MRVLCSHCRKRKGIYLKRQSGLVLCSICFKRMIIKNATLSLRRFRDLRTDEKFMILLASGTRALVNSLLLYIIEKSFPKVKLIALCADEYLLQYYKKFLSNLKIEIVDTFKIKSKSYSDYWIEVIKKGANYAREYDCTALSIPITLDDITTLFLAKLFKSGTLSILPDYIDSIKVVKILERISLKEVVIFALLEHIPLIKSPLKFDKVDIEVIKYLNNLEYQDPNSKYYLYNFISTIRGGLRGFPQGRPSFIAG